MKSEKQKMSQPVASTQPPVDTRQAQLKKLQSLLRDVFSAQQFLIEVKQLRKEQWELISMYLQKKEYLEVVEERSCNHKCGFCFCNNPTSTIEEQRLERWAKSRGEEPKQPSLLDPRPPDNLELLEFSRTKGDFVDSSEKLYYCSNSCFVESKLLIESLDVLPLNLRKIPWSDFNECLRAMNTAKTDAIEREQRGEAPDVVMLDANPVNKRELHTVKEELAAVKADHSNIKITENERVAEPSDDFQIQDGIPLPMKPRKMQLPFFSATQSFLADLITDKTKEFLTTLKTQETSVTEEDLNSYSFQPLSATFKRYKALENTVTKEFVPFEHETFRFFNSLKGLLLYRPVLD